MSQQNQNSYYKLKEFFFNVTIFGNRNFSLMKITWSGIGGEWGQQCMGEGKRDSILLCSALLNIIDNLLWDVAKKTKDLHFNVNSLWVSAIIKLTFIRYLVDMISPTSYS